MQYLKKEGKFDILKVQDFTLGETPNGNYYAEAVLVVEDGGENYYAGWTGFFTEKTKAKTVSMIKLLKPSTTDFDELISVNAAELFNPEDVTLTIQAETLDSGNVVFKGKWINKKSQKAKKEDQLKIAKKLNLSGLLMSSMNRDKEEVKEEVKEEPKDLDSIPF